MLKVEYPCREHFASYTPAITAAQAKKHLHDIRLQRQNQLATTINECYRLRNIHKQAFDRLFDSCSTEKSRQYPPRRVLSPLHVRKCSTPRIDYASLIYQRATPALDVERLPSDEHVLPVIKELTQHLSRSPCTISNRQSEPRRSLSAVKDDWQRRLSVSSVSSHDKRANKVFEKWPDYNRISEIVGYRINPPGAKPIALESDSSPPTKSTNQRNRGTSNKAPKSKKPATRKSRKPIAEPVVIDEPPPPTLPPISLSKPVVRVQPKLPDLLCPSSVLYSHRIQTRQWLMKHNFATNTIRTLPLL